MIKTHSPDNHLTGTVLNQGEGTNPFDEFNNTTTPYPSKTLPELFMEQSKKTPDNIALLCGDTALSYAQLNQKTNQLAHYLRHFIDKTNPYIAIYMDRTPDLILCILSILKAGGAYVPLDIHIPKERMHYIFENSQTSLVLTDSACQTDLPKTSVPVLCVDKIIKEINQYDDHYCDFSQLDELAYIIFTSGSTGQPKGVTTEHQAICNTLLHFKQAMQVKPQDILLSLTTITFDPSILDIFLPLISGAKLILAPYFFNREPSLIEHCINEEKVTMMQATPATWKALINNGWLGKPDLRVLSMGEPLALDLAQQLVIRSQCIWNLYGPTELAIYSSAEQITAESDLQFISIGKPIANVQLYILDELMQQVPIGTPGELYIGGKGIGRGYLNPELTKERYVPAPVDCQSNRLLYKTGDLCTWLPDGRVKIFGRMDFQVKIRGFRIELGEIEIVLKRQPQVRDVVVMASEDDPENKKLIAYYLSNQPDKSIADRVLHDYLKNYLPEYMVPAAFVHLNQFPLNANGKIDRSALPKLDFRRDRPCQSPQNFLEQRLKTLWEEVLTTDGISVNDSIFSIGGNSLLMMSILTKVSHTFKLNIAFHEFYQNPTIAQLAQLIEQKIGRPEQVNDFIITKSPISLLSEAQLNLWIINKFYPDSTALNIIETIRIAGVLNNKALDFALDCIIQKHPLLSCQISLILPIQIKQAGRKPYYERTSLQHLSPKEQEQALQSSQIELKAYKTLDRGNALLQLRLFDLSDKQSEIHLCVSHLVADKIAVNLLISELSHFYNQFGPNSPEILSGTTYMDHMALREYNLRKTLKKDSHFWTQFLTNISPFTLAAQDLIHPRLCKQLNCISSIGLSDHKLNDLQIKSNRYQVSLIDTLNAMIATALINYSDSEGSNFILTLVKSGRETETENNIIGNFARGNLIKISTEGQPSIMELAQRIHQSVIDSEQYQTTYGCAKYPLPAKKSFTYTICRVLFRAYIKVMKILLALFYKKKMNPDFYYRYSDMIATIASTKQPKTVRQPVQVNVNVLNNFLLADEKKTLFRFPILNVEEYFGQGISAPNTLSFLLFREPASNKPYLSLQGNISQESREQILQRMEELLTQ